MAQRTTTPPATPSPPAASAPPPRPARVAFVNAAPLRVDMAVPVLAVPNEATSVVATAGAPTPPAIPAAMRPPFLAIRTFLLVFRLPSPTAIGLALVPLHTMSKSAHCPPTPQPGSLHSTRQAVSLHPPAKPPAGPTSEEMARRCLVFLVVWSIRLRTHTAKAPAFTPPDQ